MKNVRRWHPTSGEHKVFADSDDAPADWLDRHPNTPVDAVVEAPPAAMPKPAPLKVAVDPNAMTRKQIRVALDEGGVQYDKTADTDELSKLLDEKVRAVLTEQGRDFDPKASTKELLGLLSPAE